MTQGECAFYLRELHPHWTTSTLSSEKLGELAEAKLIDVQPGHPNVVRLTSAGEQYKLHARSRNRNSLPLSRAQSAQTRSRRRAGSAFKPKPLV